MRGTVTIHAGHSSYRNRVDAVGMLRIRFMVPRVSRDAFRPPMTAPASGRQIAAIYTRLRILVRQNIMIAMTADTARSFAVTLLRKFCVNARLEGCDLLRMTTVTARLAELTCLVCTCCWCGISYVTARATHIGMY